jgi:drug/metabolite transporter (DMT)-like permease
MGRGYLVSLAVLSSVWGASYLFIKVAVDDLEPTFMMCLRCLIAAPFLLAFLAWRSGARRAVAQVVGAWRPGLVLGFVNAAFPFSLIAWGEKHIDSGIAAIANATVAIFVALLAIRFKPSERASGVRLLGILIGFGGVAVLAGARPEGGWWAVLGTLAVVLASLSYATGQLAGQHNVANVPGPVLATASMLYGGLILVPFALVQLPDRAPDWDSVGALLGLSLLGTTFAQLVLFRMLRLYGSSRTSLVTYLLPAFALFYGATILDEPITASALIGFALILGGVALGSGVVRGRRAAVVQSP